MSDDHQARKQGLHGDRVNRDQRDGLAQQSLHGQHFGAADTEMSRLARERF